MRPLSYDHATSVGLLREELAAFVNAAAAFSERDLLGASRCHGWSLLDVVVHVRAGLEEMTAGCAAQAAGPAGHDAASYWASSADGGEDDPVPHILWLRRTASAYTRPASAVRHLETVGANLNLALAAMPDQPVLFQDKAMSSGDFLATWVVEVAVHHLDLSGATGGPTAESLHVVRQTVEAVADVDLPAAWDDQQSALISLGRVPLPEDAGSLVGTLPVAL